MTRLSLIEPKPDVYKYYQGYKSMDFITYITYTYSAYKSDLVL